MTNRTVGTKQPKEYIKKLIVQEAIKQGVDPALALAVAQHESGFNNIAISPKNKNGSRDHGVFQLNDKYHKLKNVYDPQENIAYGIKHLKGLLAGAKGNVAKALSDYNAGAGAKGEGRAKGDAYAKKVMNLIPQYSKNSINQIAQSSPRPTAQINKQGELVGDTSSLKGGKNKMQNMPTGAASGVDNTQGIIYRDPVTGEVIDRISLYDMAKRMEASGNTPSDIAQSAQQGYLNMLDDPRVQARMNRQVGYTPEQLNQMMEAQAQMLQNAQVQNASNVGGYQQMLQDLYNRQNEVIMSDPRLQNQGYYVDPSKIGAQAAGQTMLANLGLGGRYVSAQDLATMRAENNLANQYGIPYETLVAANQDRINNQLKALQNQGTSLDALIEAAQTGDQNAINQLQYVFKTAQELGKETIGKQADLDKEIASQYMQGLRDPISPSVTAYGNQQTQAQQNYANLVKAYVDGGFSLDEALIRAETDLKQTQMQSETAIQNQNTQSGTQYMIAQEDRPIKGLNATANMTGALSPVNGWTDPRVQGAMINALPENQRNLMVDPSISQEAFQQAITPQVGYQTKKLDLPTSAENLANRYLGGVNLPTTIQNAYRYSPLNPAAAMNVATDVYKKMKGQQ